METNATPGSPRKLGAPTLRGSPRTRPERSTVGKGTIKVKKKCCHSKPPCDSCPIVLLRKLLRESKAEELKKAEKKTKKANKKKDDK